MDDLQERINQFQALELPGQPRMMHMGTSYLVNDLWREVQKLKAICFDHELNFGAAEEEIQCLEDRVAELEDYNRWLSKALNEETQGPRVAELEAAIRKFLKDCGTRGSSPLLILTAALDRQQPLEKVFDEFDRLAALAEEGE